MTTTKTTKTAQNAGFLLGLCSSLWSALCLPEKPGPHSLDRCPQSSELNPSWSFQCQPPQFPPCISSKALSDSFFRLCPTPHIGTCLCSWGSTSPGHVLSLVKWSITNSSMTRLAPAVWSWQASSFLDHTQCTCKSGSLRRYSKIPNSPQAL